MEQQLTKDGKQLWDSIDQYDNKGQLITPKHAVKSEVNVNFKSAVTKMINKYNGIIKENQLELKEYIKKEHYFKANEAKVTIFIYSNLIMELSILIADPSDIITLEKEEANNVIYIK